MENNTTSTDQILPSVPNLDRPSVIINDIPPRFQWDKNKGYCGEVSMISAGLYYGQYLSQYAVREIALLDNPDDVTQLLLGINDGTTAEALKLKYEAKTGTDSAAFIQWIKEQVALGYPVIIGVLNNEFLLQENTTDPLAGDREYDHIVPVIGVGSFETLPGSFLDTDKILISDNGLFSDPTNEGVPPENVAYYFAYEIKNFFSNRENANSPDGNMYSLLELPKYQTPSDSENSIKQNYAIAIQGVMGQEETFPVRIKTNINYEVPSVAHGVPQPTEPPAPLALVLTITVSNLVPGVTYLLYRYSFAKEVPEKNFNDNSPQGSLLKTIRLAAGTTYTTTLAIQSDEKVFLRAVKAPE